MRRGSDAGVPRSLRRTLGRLDWRVRGQQAVDALAYAAVLAGSVAAVGTALGLAFRGNLIAAKRLLFLAGFGLVGYAAFRLRPRSPWKRDGARESGGRSRPRGLQATVARALPAAVRPPPDRRLSAAAKLFVAGATMLLGSLFAEVVLGVGV